MAKTNRILIVDDNPNMSSLLSEILDFFDFQGVGARDGEEALEILKNERFDMVITDLRMPRMGGMDLLHTLKNRFPQLPVVVITGFGTDSSKEDVFAAKADGFLVKPFKVDQIKELLKRFVGYRE